ncbi:hypothetical protein [Corynebacterium doosanense]|uniref:Membrane protein n=1 Tax=Corynebacterium doosanense CAU 212 = DSM 45436 TaxID=558173 RepID=A0A097IIW3_9CORY|nr:hypothetical protein [Corynebacterium doosanense]AIT62048.1 membrane protein [Corynebacterium doosanense CAU 212 = DSM 45436]
MYAWLIHLIPGRRWFRVLVVFAVAIAVFLLFMEVVFPWVSERMPYAEVAV